MPWLSLARNHGYYYLIAAKSTESVLSDTGVTIENAPCKTFKEQSHIKGDLQNEEVKDITFLIPKHTKATVSTKHDMHVIFEEIISPPTSFEVIA
jgi:hypothetical protein